MTKYLINPPVFLRTGIPELRLKDKADLVECKKNAFIFF